MYTCEVSAYGRNLGLLALGETQSLCPLLGFVTTVCTWCTVLRAGLPGVMSDTCSCYCSDDHSVLIPLWDSLFCPLSAGRSGLW